MPSDGLTGKKYIGKIVEGFDPQQRGRYYVHIPDFQPHMAESKGILLPNNIQSSRVANGNTGSYGTQIPLHVGTQVQVECLTDDISSARVMSVVSDDQPKSDMCPGKIMGVEPSGQIVPIAVSGLPEKVPFGSADNDIVGKLNEIINSGGKMAQEIFESVKDKLGDTYDKIAETFGKASEAAAQIEAQFSQAVQNVQDKISEIGEGVVDAFTKATDEVTKIGEQFAISAEEKLQGVVGNVEDVIKQVMEKKPEGQEGTETSETGQSDDSSTTATDENSGGRENNESNGRNR